MQNKLPLEIQQPVTGVVSSKGNLYTLCAPKRSVVALGLNVLKVTTSSKIYKIAQSKMNHVITYSPSRCSKSIWPFFLLRSIKEDILKRLVTKWFWFPITSIVQKMTMKVIRKQNCCYFFLYFLFCKSWGRLSIYTKNTKCSPEFLTTDGITKHLALFVHWAGITGVNGLELMGKENINSKRCHRIRYQINSNNT